MNFATNDRTSFGPETLSESASFFVSYTVGGLIGNKIFNLDFNPVIIPIHSAITTGLLYSAGLVYSKIKN